MSHHVVLLSEEIVDRIPCDLHRSDKESSSSDSSDSDSSSLESDSTSRATTEPRQRKQQRSRRKPRAASHSGSDSDDSESGIGGGSRVAPKTEHEMEEPEVQLPEVMKIDEGAEIAKFGKVESVIETVVVVKADTAGDWRVLDEGTVVCWEDRTVIGTVRLPLSKSVRGLSSSYLVSSFFEKDL